MNLLRALRGHAWLWKTRRPLSDEARADAADVLRAYGTRRLPRIWIVEGVGQPFVWGLLRGSIYVPPSFLSIENPEHRRDVLAHELSHVLRFDAAVNVLQVVAQGLFWFHPFVWWANRKICQEREKCCDEMVIARLHTTPKDYSTAIVETLARAGESARPVPSLAVAGPLRHIEERIKTMLRPGGRFYRRPSLAAAVVVILVALATVPTAVVLTAQPKYLVSGLIHIVPITPGLLDAEPKSFDRDAYASFMRTQAAMLTSEQVLSRVANDLAPRGLAYLSSAKTSAARERPVQDPANVLRQAVAKGVIKAAFLQDTELLAVTMASENEEEGKIIVDSFRQNYAATFSINEAVKVDQNLRVLEDKRHELLKTITEMRHIHATANEVNVTGADAAKTVNPGVQSQQLEMKLTEELYEKVSRRIQEIQVGLASPPRVQVIGSVEVTGIMDNRGQWALIILGATIAGVLILLIMWHATKSKRE
jgi:hypothetical protein